jgi:1,2-diacylglycerol 3-alpha-glucosyltransferase
MADADPSPVPRVAVAFHRLGPYHHARLRAAAAQPIDLHAVAFSRSGGEYAWHDVPDAGDGGGAYARVTTLFEHAASEGADRAGMRRRVGHALDALAPDAVAIPGWSQPLALMILRHCLRRGWPVILMSESTRGDADRRRWREAVKRRVVALCGAALVGGAPHRAYARDLGFPDGAIEEGYDAIDDAYFARAADAARAGELRAHHGLPERFFLASSRFVAKKNLPRLIEAYALYHRRAATTSGSNPWKLVLLGDGPMGERLRSEIRRHGLNADVILPGFRQYDELPAYYGLAGAFVHASTVEQWGLVVNEAMASGLPVVVSERCGCAPDLVKEGVNGFTFDPDDAGQLAGLLARVAALDPGERGRMGAAGRAIVRAWGPERFAEGLLRTVRVALASPRPTPGAVDRALLHALATWPRQP